jgi:ABC-type nitrate/sulfonate/bicarbonate transport system ATPase subunit
LNLWGNAREGSEVPTELQSRSQPADRRREPGGAPAVAVERVSRAYRGEGGATVHALADVSLHAAAGELLAVVGPSGCGKSTLLELICALQRPDSGRVACAPAVLMPQRDLLLPWLTALDNAALALRIARVSRARARARASTLFAELGLDGFQRARPHELSGGMRQRVAFARTLLSGKPLLCLDEPFGALDAITRGEMQEWLARALARAGLPTSRVTPGMGQPRTTGSRPGRRRSRTVVLVTHDVEEAILLADRVAVLSRRPGRVVAELAVEITHPRSRTDPEVLALRERALSALSAGGAL